MIYIYIIFSWFRSIYIWRERSTKIECIEQFIMGTYIFKTTHSTTSKQVCKFFIQKVATNWMGHKWIIRRHIWNSKWKLFWLTTIFYYKIFKILFLFFFKFYLFRKIMTYVYILYITPLFNYICWQALFVFLWYQYKSFFIVNYLYNWKNNIVLALITFYLSLK